MPGMMDYSLNLALNVVVNRATISSSVQQVEASFNHAVQRSALGFTGVMADAVEEVRVAADRLVTIPFAADTKTLEKGVAEAAKAVQDRLREGGPALRVDPKSWAEISAAARQLGAVSTEKLFDPEVMERMLAMSERLKLITEMQGGKALLLKDQYSALANQLEWFRASSVAAYDEVTGGIRKALADYQEMGKTGKYKPLDPAALDSLKKLRDRYTQMEPILQRAVGLTNKQKEGLDDQVVLLEKLIVREEKRKQVMEGIAKTQRALGVDDTFVRLLGAVGRAELVIGGMAKGLKHLWGIEESVHETNYRLYGSMQDISAGLISVASEAQATSEEATAAWMALAATGAPRDAIRELAIENTQLARVTGASNRSIAQFQRIMLTYTGNTKEAAKATNSLLYRMQHMGLTGSDVEEVLGVVTDRAADMSVLFGTDQPAKFAQILGVAAGAAKNFGVNAQKGIIDIGKRMAAGGVDIGIAAMLGTAALYESPRKQMEMLVSASGDLNAQLKGMDRVTRSVYMELYGINQETLDALEEVNKEVEKEIRLGRTRDQAEKIVGDRQFARDKKNQESQKNMARQWKLVKEVGLRALEVLLTPLSHLATAMAPIVEKLAQWVTAMDKGLLKAGGLGTAIKLLGSAVLFAFSFKALAQMKTFSGLLLGVGSVVKGKTGVLGFFQKLLAGKAKAQKDVEIQGCVKACDLPGLGKATELLPGKAALKERPSLGRFYGTGSSVAGREAAMLSSSTKQLTAAQSAAAAASKKAAVGSLGFFGKIKAGTPMFHKLGAGIAGVGGNLGRLGGSILGFLGRMPVLGTIGRVLGGVLGKVPVIGWVITAFMLFGKEIWGMVQSIWKPFSRILGVVWKGFQILERIIKFALTPVILVLSKVFEGIGVVVGWVATAMEYYMNALVDAYNFIADWIPGLSRIEKFETAAAEKRKAEAEAGKTEGDVSDAAEEAFHEAEKSLAQTAREAARATLPAFEKQYYEISEMSAEKQKAALAAMGMKDMSEYQKMVSETRLARDVAARIPGQGTAEASGMEARLAEMGQKAVGVAALVTDKEAVEQVAVRAVAKATPAAAVAGTETAEIPKTKVMTETTTPIAGREDVATLRIMAGILSEINGKVNLAKLNDYADFMKNQARTDTINLAGLPAEANQWHQSR